MIRSLPAFATDRLQPQWCGGGLLLEVCSDDVILLSYAVRRLVQDARDQATVRWSQAGFNPARGSEDAHVTPRNLFGQRDGTANPLDGSPELDQAVWSRGEPDWMVGGSHLVFRRIIMDVDIWGRACDACDGADARRKMLRRGFSFDDGPTVDGQSNAGLLFAAYQANAATAFVSVQKRLAEADALNL